MNVVDSNKPLAGTELPEGNIYISELIPIDADNFAIDVIFLAEPKTPAEFKKFNDPIKDRLDQARAKGNKKVHMIFSGPTITANIPRLSTIIISAIIRGGTSSIDILTDPNLGITFADLDEPFQWHINAILDKFVPMVNAIQRVQGRTLTKVVRVERPDINDPQSVKGFKNALSELTLAERQQAIYIVLRTTSADKTQEKLTAREITKREFANAGQKQAEVAQMIKIILDPES